MPLTLERDGLFRGRRDSADAWYIVDPEVDGGVDTAIAAWRTHYASTNRPAWQRGARVGVFVGVWVLATSVGALLAFVVIPGVDGWRGFIVVGAALLGAALAGRVMASVFAPRHVAPLGNLAIAVVPPEIEEWADDDRLVADIGALVTAWRHVDEVNILLSLVNEEWWTEQGQRRPDEAIESLVEPILREQWTARRVRLNAIATELGFQPPEEWITDLPPASEFRQS